MSRFFENNGKSQAFKLEQQLMENNYAESTEVISVPDTRITLNHDISHATVSSRYNETKVVPLTEEFNQPKFLQGRDKGSTTTNDMTKQTPYTEPNFIKRRNEVGRQQAVVRQTNHGYEQAKAQLKEAKKARKKASIDLFATKIMNNEKVSLKQKISALFYK